MIFITKGPTTMQVLVGCATRAISLTVQKEAFIYDSAVLPCDWEPQDVATALDYMVKNVTVDNGFNQEDVITPLHAALNDLQKGINS
jgi:hypothetical protein